MLTLANPSMFDSFILLFWGAALALGGLLGLIAMPFMVRSYRCRLPIGPAERHGSVDLWLSLKASVVLTPLVWIGGLALCVAFAPLTEALEFLLDQAAFGLVSTFGTVFVGVFCVLYAGRRQRKPLGSEAMGDLLQVEVAWLLVAAIVVGFFGLPLLGAGGSGGLGDLLICVALLLVPMAFFSSLSSLVAYWTRSRSRPVRGGFA